MAGDGGGWLASSPTVGISNYYSPWIFKQRAIEWVLSLIDNVIISPNLDFVWLTHGFGLRDSAIPPDLTTVRQVHSAIVLDACGRRGEQIGEGDAIISTESGVTIGVRTADCVPILLADTVNRTVACAHAGWRGTAANIIGATVGRLEALGSRAADLHVAIGPSIGSCCYEVGADVARQFQAWMDAPPSGWGEHTAVDLPKINEIQLREAGVGKIWISGECTFCRPERFFSFRREKEQAGRMLSYIGTVV